MIDRILRPEQVFRGFLVSTLTCQDCYNVSSRHEYFLDMSLPVSVEKSQPPQIRRKTSPDNANSFYLHPAPANSSPIGPTKSQLKKDRSSLSMGFTSPLVKTGTASFVELDEVVVFISLRVNWRTMLAPFSLRPSDKTLFVPAASVAIVSPLVSEFEAEEGGKLAPAFAGLVAMPESENKIMKVKDYVWV